MKVDGKHYRTVWLEDGKVKIIDQRWLPHRFVIEKLDSVDDFAVAIKDMHVRGAGLIGATACYGMYVAAHEAPDDDFDNYLKICADKLTSTRPTATNLAWAVKRQLEEISKGKTVQEKKEIALNVANEIADEDAAFCKRIGEHGVKIIEEISKRKDGDVVNILTHCNAGWLAFVDHGSATAPIYAAYEKGIKVHVWVDETRPRNQGAKLTAWELGQHGVPHTVIVDNVGGHLMQHGMVDMVIVGTDRTTYTGDVANKIGTYLKALAAKDNDVPFYVALPSSTFDWKIRDGVKEVPIEERDAEEVRFVDGLSEDEVKEVLITPENSDAANYAFDVTPSRLVTGLITERGVMEANENSILAMYPEYDEGYIKYNIEFVEKEIDVDVNELNKFRDYLFSKGFIGGSEGIGFGNVSLRVEDGFIITGTATGLKEKLYDNDYTKVIDYDIDKNWLKCEGMVKASSESLTHAAVYEADPSINVVVHIHDLELWDKLKDIYPVSSESASYGTPEIANEVKGLVNDKGVIVLGGHKEGIMVFGKDFEKVKKILENFK